MISGCFSISGDNSNLPDLPYVDIHDPGLTFHDIESSCFRGRYWLHSRLPLTGDDFLYIDRDSDLIILFSGNIYNKKELASDYYYETEVRNPLIAAWLFRRVGPDFVKLLNGDFAIFICEPGKRQAYLFRDQVGVRPLAWHSNGNNLYFSSDITGLCRFASNGKGPDAEFLMGFFKYVDLTKTPDREVHRLMPGHYLQFSDRGISINRYWNPEETDTDRKMSYDRMMSDLRVLLFDAIAIRCDRKFNAGAHTSSGIDSGIVAAIARHEYPDQNPFFGFSWSPEKYTPDEIPYDERELVRKLCVKSGIDPVFCDIETAEFHENVSDLYVNKSYFIEEHLLKQAEGRGVNLIFSGWGGDEFISTGDRGIETDLLRSLKLRIYFHRNPPRYLKRFIKYFLTLTLFPVLGIMQPGVAKAFSDDAKYLKRRYRKSRWESIRNFYFHTSRRQMHLRYFRLYHLQERCETWSIMGYRKGVEYRFPLLDKRIIEYILKIPSELLCRTDHFRPLLRILGEGILPDEVLLNYNKKDHVYSAWWKDLHRYSGNRLLDEAAIWKGSTDLSFINFDLLMHDISRFRNGQPGVNPEVLLKALVYIKAVYQFSVTYRRRLNGTGE